MKYYKRWAFLFLYLTTFTKIECRSDTLAEINSQLENYGISSERLSETISKVIVNDNDHEVYIFEPSNYYYNTLTKSYLYVNCEIAEGIRERLMNKIELIPLLYQKAFTSVYHTIFTRNLKLPGTLDDVIEYAEKSINILLNFSKLHLDNYDSSINTNILRTLLSLSFKIEFIKIHEETLSNARKLDRFALSYILGTLHLVQQFILFNCNAIYYNGKKKLYGLTSIKYNKNDEDFNTFISVLRTMNIEKPERCNIYQMIMQNKISWKFGSILWKTNYGPVSIQEVNMNLHLIYRSLDLIFWYQNFMFNTIIKLLFYKTLVQYESEVQISDNTVNKLKKFITPMLEIQNLPSKITFCLSLLMQKNYKNHSDKKNFVNTISTCMEESLPNIILINAPDINSSKDGFLDVDVSINFLSISMLEDFINYFNEVDFELKCFFELFKLLYNHNDSYNVSPAHKLRKHKQFEEELTKRILSNKKNNDDPNDKTVKNPIIEESKEKTEEMELIQEGCKYFKSLYHFFYETMMYLNMTHIKTINKMKKEQYVLHVKIVLKKIVNYLEKLAFEYFNIQQYEVLYKVLPVLELVFNSNIIFSYDDTKRLLSVVMIDLNLYSVNYCKPPDYNFSLLNNIDFSITGRHSVIHDAIESSLKSLKKKNAFYDCKYLSIRELFNDFDDYTSTFNQYNSIIQMNWKGQTMNIIQIHKSVANSFTDASTLYSMYNNYFKFSLVAVYFELQRAYYEIKNDQTSENDYQLQFDFNSWDPKYLARYNIIIDNIYNFHIYLANVRKHKDKIEDVDQKLINQFKRIGVSVDVSQVTSSTLHTSIKGNIDDIFKFTGKVTYNISKNCSYVGKVVSEVVEIKIT